MKLKKRGPPQVVRLTAQLGQPEKPMTTPKNEHPAKAHFANQMARLKPGHFTKLSAALLLEVFQSESEAVEWFKTLGVILDPFWKECGASLATVMRPNGEVRGASRLSGEASSREAATSTDGLGVAVPPVPTFGKDE